MTYEDVLETLAAAARTVDSSATYYRGRISDISLSSHVANTNLIYVEDTFRISPQAQSATEFETWNIRIGFFRQDSTASESMEANQNDAAEESREVIFSKTNLLARKYLEALYNENLMIQGTPNLEQVTRSLQGTFTGWILTISVLIAVDCDDVEGTSIADAVYKNSDNTYNVSIPRATVHTAPDITVTDSDGSTYEHPANTDVVCTPGGGAGSPATVTIKNSDDEVLDSFNAACGTAVNRELADETFEIEIDGNLNQSFTIPALKSEEIEISW